MIKLVNSCGNCIFVDIKLTSARYRNSQIQLPCGSAIYEDAIYGNELNSTTTKQIFDCTEIDYLKIKHKLTSIEVPKFRKVLPKTTISLIDNHEITIKITNKWEKESLTRWQLTSY